MFFGLIILGVLLSVYLIYCLIDLSFIEKEFNLINNKIEKKYSQNTYGYENFITQKEKKTLLNFIQTNLNHFKIRSDEKELLCTIQDLPNYPKKIISKLRKRIIELEKIEEHYPDIIHQDAVSVIYQGGFHDYHRDVNYLNWCLVRYNIILSKPDDGGLSVYGDEMNDWDENTIWKCVAGNVKHGVTKVFGSKPRIVLCLGFLIKQEDVIKKQHKKPVINFENLPTGFEYMNPVD